MHEAPRDRNNRLRTGNGLASAQVTNSRFAFLSSPSQRIFVKPSTRLMAPNPCSTFAHIFDPMRLRAFSGSSATPR